MKHLKSFNEGIFHGRNRNPILNELIQNVKDKVLIIRYHEYKKDDKMIFVFSFNDPSVMDGEEVSAMKIINLHLQDSGRGPILSRGFDTEYQVLVGGKKLNVKQYHASKFFDLAEGEEIGRSFKDIISQKHGHLIDEIIHNYSNARVNDNGANHTILECHKGENEQEVPLEISYTIWGERVSPIITATIKDMRPY